MTEYNKRRERSPKKRSNQTENGIKIFFLKGSIAVAWKGRKSLWQSDERDKIPIAQGDKTASFHI